MSDAGESGVGFFDSDAARTFMSKAINSIVVG